MVGCQDKEAMAELEEFKAQAALEEQNKELIRNYLKVWEERNWESLKEFFAPNALVYYPSNAEGKPPEEEKIGGMSEVYLKVEELLAVGNKVIARGVLQAIPMEEYQVKLGTDKIEYSWITMFQIEDGKILEIRDEVDMLGFVQQLGMELKPKEGEE
jgi:predicted ester cyclase